MKNFSRLLLLGALTSACTSTPNNNDSGTGSDASTNVPLNVAYIRRAPYPKLVIEVDSVPTAAPRAAVETDLASGLMGILDKPGGVTVQNDGTITSRGTDHVWTFNELNTLAGETFNLAVTSDTVKMHVMFVDGHYEADTANSKVLGVAWASQHLVLFKQTMEELCQGTPLLSEQICRAAEFGVWTHETGHLLGLVDNGLAMVTPHKDSDPTHGAHDSSQDCVMFWQYEGSSVVDLFRQRAMSGASMNLGFDQHCIDDINAVK